MKALLKKYQQLVRKTCMDTTNTPLHSVIYWQNKLFATTMEVVLPLSLLANIPSILFSFYHGLYILGFLNIFSLGLILFIGLGKGVSPTIRKMLLIAITYLAAIYLLFYLGFKGPGFLFLYSACVFALLILPGKYAYWWSWINVGICAAFALIFHFQLSPAPGVQEMGVLEWLIISANLIFLSFLSSMLLPKLFGGIAATFNRQQELERSLRAKQKDLEATLGELEDKNAEMEQFVYFASHDLQEPLRMVNSFLGRLQEKYDDQLDDKAREYIHFATDGASRMRQTIHALLDLSRIGRQQDEMSTISLNDVINDVQQLLQDEISSNDVTIHYDHLPEVAGYRSSLEKIFQNLLSNAIKYRKDDFPPEIQIEAEDMENEWQISIRDNGIGIEEAHHHKIFDIFQRLHGKGKYGGTGIGLAIVKKSVEGMGGRIWVSSQPGKGSTFTFTLKKPTP